MSISTPPSILVQRGEEDNYKEVVGKLYKEFISNRKYVTKKYNGDVDPINQRTDKYLPKPVKSNDLKNGYLVRMGEEKDNHHKKTFPMKGNLDYKLYAELQPKDFILHKKPKPNNGEGLDTTNKKFIKKIERKRIYPKKDDNLTPLIQPDNKNVVSGTPAMQIKVNRRKYIPSNDTNDILLMQPKHENYLYRHQYQTANGFYPARSTRHSQNTFERIFNSNSQQKNRVLTNGRTSPIFREHFTKPKPKHRPTQSTTNICRKDDDSINQLFHSTNNFNSTYEKKKKSISLKPNQLDFNDLSKQAKIVLKERYSGIE